MLKSLPFLIPFVVFGVLILVTMRIIMSVPDYIASFLRRTWGINPIVADLLGILGWVAVGFTLVYFIARNLWTA